MSYYFFHTCLGFNTCCFFSWSVHFIRTMRKMKLCIVSHCVICDVWCVTQPIHIFIFWSNEHIYNTFHVENFWYTYHQIKPIPFEKIQCLKRELFNKWCFKWDVSESMKNVWWSPQFVWKFNKLSHQVYESSILARILARILSVNKFKVSKFVIISQHFFIK